MTRDAWFFPSMFGSMLALAALLTGAWGCGPGESDGDPEARDGGDGGGDGGTTVCTPGTICAGNEAVTCLADGTEGARTDCAAAGQVCVDGTGCALCEPGTFRCSGAAVERCSSDGVAWAAHATCDASMGETCDPEAGACTTLCEVAAASHSYMGCEYWPVTTLSSQVDESFSPAVEIANPQAVPATVTITRSGFSVGSTEVAPGGTATVLLPWVPELKQELGSERSVLVPGGAYHLVSNVPVTVSQLTPLETEQDGDFSSSGDASLLLPTHAMTGNYMVMSRPARLIEREDSFSTSLFPSPGFLSVVAVGAAPVDLNIQFRGRVTASTDGSIRAFAEGDIGSFTLNQGDVLQIASASPSSCDRAGGSYTTGLQTDYYCQVGDEYDLTGTEIRADGPVQVIAGHNCAFVPFDRRSCDHLEESLFPLEVWGTESIVSKMKPPAGRTEPNVLRVLSGRDGNRITFDPPGVASETTLDRGEHMELEASESVRVRGTEALLVGQFTVGQLYGAPDSSNDGDPSMSLAVPTEQLRSEYTFLAPSTYPTSFVNVTAPDGASVTLDGFPVSLTQAVGGSGFSVGQIAITPGEHRIAADQPLGIVLYGHAPYTSYAYPGGLDLEPINVPF